jgi:exosortase
MTAVPAAQQNKMSKLPPGPTFLVLCAISLILWFRPLLDTVALAIADDQFTHILLILPISAALIIQGWREWSFEFRTWTPAAVTLLISLVIGLWVRWGTMGATPDLRLTIAMVGLIGWWISSFLLCFGRPALHAFRFPLFFLFWMVPIPTFALHWIVAALQQGSSLSAQWLFWVFRVPVTREGTILTIPGLEIEVATECSSIRSSLMLLVTTMVLAHVLLRTPWRKVLLVLLALPLSVAKNGLRIFVIAMLGTRVDAGYLTGRFHHHGGIVFFLIALAVIALFLWILGSGERAGVTTPPLHPAKS